MRANATIEPVPGVRGLLVRLGGTLDGESEESVTDAVDTALQRVVDTGGDLVLIDLTEVTRLGTLGTAVVLHAHEAAAEIGVDVGVIAPPGSPAAREWADAGLSDTIALMDTVEHALRDLPRNPA